MSLEPITPAQKGVEWFLLSTKPVEGTGAAKMVVRYYGLRWLIERFHYILKSGANVMDFQLKTPERVLNAVAAYST